MGRVSPGIGAVRGGNSDRKILKSWSVASSAQSIQRPWVCYTQSILQRMLVVFPLPLTGNGSGPRVSHLGFVTQVPRQGIFLGFTLVPLASIMWPRNYPSSTTNIHLAIISFMLMHLRFWNVSMISRMVCPQFWFWWPNHLHMLPGLPLSGPWTLYLPMPSR